MPLLFLVVPRSGCFAISDQPTVSAVQAIGLSQPLKGFSITAYHLGVSRTLAHVLIIFTHDVFFDQIIAVRYILSPATTFAESLPGTRDLI